MARAEAAVRGWSWACSRAGASPGPATGHARRVALYIIITKNIIDPVFDDNLHYFLS